MFKRIFLVGMVTILTVVTLIFTPTKRNKSVTLFIPKNLGSVEIAKHLAKNNIVDFYPLFVVASFYAKLTGQPLKYGEYFFPAKISTFNALQILTSGKTVLHFFTVPEGVSVHEIIQKIEEEQLLTGNITDTPLEGSLLPETYAFSYGDDRQRILQRMENAMKVFMLQAWEQRNPQILINSPQEAIILASIIEKETAVDNERREIASVFYNRLRCGMRLQSDPTVIYGITLGKYVFTQKLTYKDLRTPTSHNTYTNHGLPISPIGCPSKKSILAALNPQETNFLFFVANGKGGHTFTHDYQQHLKNVKNWRNLNNQSAAVP